MVLSSYHPLSLSPLFAFASFPFLGQVLKGPPYVNEQSGVGGLDGRLGQGSEMERQEVLWSFNGRNPHRHLLISSLKGENTGREACLGTRAGFTWNFPSAPCGLVVWLQTVPSPFAGLRALFAFEGSDFAAGIQQCKGPGLPGRRVLQAVCRPGYLRLPLAGEQTAGAPSIC